MFILAELQFQLFRSGTIKQDTDKDISKTPDDTLFHRADSETQYTQSAGPVKEALKHCG